MQQADYFLCHGLLCCLALVPAHCYPCAVLCFSCKVFSLLHHASLLLLQPGWLQAARGRRKSAAHPEVMYLCELDHCQRCPRSQTGYRREGPIPDCSGNSHCCYTPHYYYTSALHHSCSPDFLRQHIQNPYRHVKKKD